MKILMVLTSQEQPADTGRRIGLRLGELAASYYVFADAGAVISFASTQGGPPLLDPASEEPAAQTGATRRFAADLAAQSALARTARLAGLHAGGYDALFYPGNHRDLRDLAVDPASSALIEAADATGRATAGLRQAPLAFSHARAQDGTPLVSRQGVSGSGGSVAAARPIGVVPFLAANTLRSGAVFRTAPDWQPFVLISGAPVTGQHPASSKATARVLLRVLAARGCTRQGHAA